MTFIELLRACAAEAKKMADMVEQWDVILRDVRPMERLPKA